MARRRIELSFGRGYDFRNAQFQSQQPSGNVTKHHTKPIRAEIRTTHGPGCLDDPFLGFPWKIRSRLRLMQCPVTPFGPFLIRYYNEKTTGGGYDGKTPHPEQIGVQIVVSGAINGPTSSHNYIGSHRCSPPLRAGAIARGQYGLTCPPRRFHCGECHQRRVLSCRTHRSAIHRGSGQICGRRNQSFQRGRSFPKAASAGSFSAKRNYTWSPLFTNYRITSGGNTTNGEYRLVSTQHANFDRRTFVRLTGGMS